jgi:hypothetical protein
MFFINKQPKEIWLKYICVFSFSARPPSASLHGECRLADLTRRVGRSSCGTMVCLHALWTSPYLGDVYNSYRQNDQDGIFYPSRWYTGHWSVADRCHKLNLDSRDSAARNMAGLLSQRNFRCQMVYGNPAKKPRKESIFFVSSDIFLLTFWMSCESFKIVDLTKKC